MAFDDIITQLGQFGRYQKIQYFLACIVSVLVGSAILVSVFTNHPLPHRCALPSSVYPNDTWAASKNSTHDRLVHAFISKVDDSWEKCKYYNLSEDAVKQVRMGGSVNSSLFPELTCDRWVYDRSEMDESFISQYNLVCAQTYWVPLLKVLFMVGFLVGAPLFGWLSDLIGRKKTLLIGIFIALTSGVASAFINHPAAMGTLKLLTGAAVSALFPCAFVLGIELVGPDRRLDAGIIIEYAFAIGVSSVAGVAALTKHWTWTQFSVSIPFLLLFSYWWFMPESPRWLMSKNRKDEAMEILQKAAAVNKVNLPKDCLDDEEDEGPKGNFVDILRSRVLLIRSLNIFYQWLVVAMVYYGLSLNAGNLPGSIYLNGFLSGAVEIPGYALGHLTLNRFGRKKLHFISMFLAGIFCSSNILLVYFAPDVNWAFIVVGMVGKLFITSAFAIIYIWTSELFPTSVRSVGVGTSSMFGRIGSILGPPIGDIAPQIGGKIGQALPLVIFGAVSIVAAILCLFIPETLGRQLPETIQDGENFGKQKHAEKGHDNKAIVPDELTKPVALDSNGGYNNPAMDNTKL